DAAAEYRTRTATTLLLGGAGLLMVAGVWIDHRVLPVPFIMVWMAVAAMLAATVPLALLDVARIHRQTKKARAEIIAAMKKPVDLGRRGPTPQA
ncbi:MAG: hypothetical protein ACRDD1_21920, partial [Planctomycetia bacterium]